MFMLTVHLYCLPLARFCIELVHGEDRLGHGFQMRTTDGFSIAVGHAIRMLAYFLQRTVDGRDPFQVVRQYRFVIGLLLEAVAIVNGVLGLITGSHLQGVFLGAGGVSTSNELRPQFEQPLALARNEGFIEVFVNRLIHGWFRLAW
ncbi:hypothetical protein ACPPVV_08795 [Rhodanobacter sp. Col0626]|uniref:hypothetical protein n=1 Tax=Rhodanobacter sp. Col0626 TaxID=3415679 RepID=UPI003CEF9F5B